MGVDIEERDWYRAEPERPGRPSLVPGLLVVLAVVAGLALAAGTRLAWEKDEPAFAVAQRQVRVESGDPLLPGLPAPGLYRDSLYVADDRWADYLAGEGICPGGERTDLPLDAQADVMVCLVDYARRRRGLAPLTTVSLLNSSSLAKADRVVRCQAFAHAACGESPDADARGAGLGGSFGENLYLADGRLGAPRVALDGWLNSAGHRTNLFRPQWRFQGIAVRTIDRFGQYRDAALWVHQFGTG